ncbi:uncharacterized protein (TIGR02284 family) [Pedobacter sp. UYP30]|uniref:ferritin-like domain-containing protein n=1 Tax=Pedobacter sp. UYP30 TaxID=1756400 RepID=UPI003392A0E2
MEHNKEIISDLKSLISILNDGKEGYTSAAETTDNVELKAVFLEYAAQRKAYEEELKAHLLTHGETSDNDSGGVLGALHRTWIDIKDALSGKDEVSILKAIETGEQAAVEKYSKLAADYATHSDHIALLNKQKGGVTEALAKVQSLVTKYQNT